MTIFELGAMGELVGAILLFASLIFVGLQIRQNSNSVKAAAAQSVLENLNLSIQVGAASRETAKVIVQGQIDFESLDEDEQFQYVYKKAILATKYMNDVWLEVLNNKKERA